MTAEEMHNEWFDNPFDKRTAAELMECYAKQYAHEILDKAAERAEIGWEYGNPYDIANSQYPVANKQSILNLKNEL